MKVDLSCFQLSIKHDTKKYNFKKTQRFQGLQFISVMSPPLSAILGLFAIGNMSVADCRCLVLQTNMSLLSVTDHVHL